MPPQPIRVCIVGAGPVGLCSAGQLLQLGDAISLTVFERSSSVGGIWGHENSDEHTTGIYAGMRINLPKEIMEFDGVKFDSITKGVSFLTREQVLRYWQCYAANILPFIRFHHTVLDLTRAPTHNKWIIAVKNSVDRSFSIEEFDAVFVCNGIFTAPHFPDYARKYEKRAIHSRHYRGISGYEGAVVAVVGMNPSGKDIGMQLAKVAKKVLVAESSASVPKYPPTLRSAYSTAPPSPENTFFGTLPANCFEGAAPVHACADALILPHGREIGDVDTVIYCTGYRYSFPFIRPESGVISLKENGSVVAPLFAHFAHADHQHSLFFIGLNYGGFVPAIVFQWQIRAAISLLTHKLHLTTDEVEKFNHARLAEMAAMGTPPRHFHKLSPGIAWAYVDYLYALCRRAGTVADGERGSHRPVDRRK